MKKLLIVLVGLASFHASAEMTFKKPKDAVKYRQSTMKIMTANFAALGSMIKGKQTYDQNLVELYSSRIAVMAATFPDGFKDGLTTKKSHSKDSVFKNKKEFDKSVQYYISLTENLNTAALSKDKGQFKTAFKSFAQSCKACHDKYKD